MRSDKHVFDCIVIGGGLSGLSAANRLVEGGVHNVVLLEARDRVGGRTKNTYATRDGSNCDVGGAYVGPTQNRLLRFAKEFKIDTYEVFNKGKVVLMIDGKRRTYSGLIPTCLSAVALLDLNSLIIDGYRLISQVRPEAPWMSDLASTYDKMTVEQYVDSMGWTCDAKKIYKLSVSTLLCCEPSEVSMMYWIWFIRNGDGFMRLADTKNGAQERKFIGGSVLISQALERKLNGKGVRVRLSAPVANIEWGSVIPGERCGDSLDVIPHEEVTVTLRSGEEIFGRRVIVAVPPPCLLNITWNPPLPSNKRQLYQRMPMGSIIKTNMYYSTAFWREKGFSGNIMCDSGPITWCYDDCKPDGTNPSIMGFVLANHCRELVEATAEERKRQICKVYAKAWGDEALHPVHYVEENWCKEEFSGGCYLGYMGCQTLSKFGPELRTPLGHVHFAGTETATFWSGYMDGAIQAGERAAHEAQSELCTTDDALPPPVPYEEHEPDPEYQIATAYSGPKPYEWCLPSVGQLAVGGGVVCMCITIALYHFIDL